MTRLSNTSLKSLVDFAKFYDKEIECKNAIDAINTFIESDQLIFLFSGYFNLSDSDINKATSKITNINEIDKTRELFEFYPYENIFLPDKDTLFTLTLRNAMLQAKKVFDSKK